MTKKYNASNVVAVFRPQFFQGNIQTVADNKYQKIDDQPVDISTIAREEHDNFVRVLRGVIGVNTLVIDSDNIGTPDAVFLNNWFSTHDADLEQERKPMVALYPMKCTNRRLERRDKFVGALKDLFDDNVQDLSEYELGDNPKFLESTGAMVFDRLNKVVYASISERCHLDLVRKFSEDIGYELVDFISKDKNDSSIYHTNVMMWVGTDVMAVCKDAVEGDGYKKIKICADKCNKDIIELSHKAVEAFAGNAFEVLGNDNKPYLILSQSAKEVLSGDNLRKLVSVYGEKNIIFVPYSEIEKAGGGSIRCSVAAIYGGKTLQQCENAFASNGIRLVPDGMLPLTPNATVGINYCDAMSVKSSEELEINL